MGSVKIDKDRNEYEWHTVNETALESIKGLLKFRQRFDPACNIDDAFIQGDDIEEYKINYSALHTYMDIDRHIDKANFSKIQRKILEKYQSGMTEQEIALELNRTQSTVNGIIGTICRKIYDEAFEEWKSYINLNVIKTNYYYKKCSKCKEFKPEHPSYFSFDLTNNRFKSRCLKCHNT
jgi:DNA-binding CsgD family transcriptional regulator